MTLSNHDRARNNNRPPAIGTIMWLTGWSMPDTIFDRLRERLPNYQHVPVDYSAVGSAEEMLQLIETAATHWQSSRTAYTPLLVAGWSLGGLLALRLAAQGWADGLVLLASTARFTRPKEQSDRGWADVYVRKMISGLAKDRQSVETNFRDMMFTQSEMLSNLGSHLPPAGCWTTSALIAGLDILRNVECLSRLPEIQCPVFLIHGAEDRICPYEAAAELAAQLPHAKLLTLPHCGHAPFLGREAEIAEQLGRWWHER